MAVAGAVLRRVDHAAAAGTVTNVREATLWLSYTYLFVRMLKNPLAYGVPWHELSADPRLEGRRKVLISDAARQLEKCARGLLPARALHHSARLSSGAGRRCKMARFDERSGNLYVTELGRVASHYYIRHASIVAFNELLKPRMGEAEVRKLCSLR